MDLEGASSSRELKYLKDIRIVFQGIFNSDPDALGEQSSINSADAVYHYVGRVDRLFSVQNCTLRVDGMIKALKSVEAVVEQAEVFTREEQAEWPSMIWGPMALALQVSNQAPRMLKYGFTNHLQRSYTSYSASDQILAVLEDLTTLSCLPVPPIAWNAEKSPYLADALLHLFAELSCGLGQFVSFLRQFEHGASIFELFPKHWLFYGNDFHLRSTPSIRPFRKVRISAQNECSAATVMVNKSQRASTRK